ncbi:Heat shock protein 90-1 [Platanthera guangdongensis]|uniref:Heat shock protein 90-1 n=1 Tax=Platanthera guangdongensis TaxID=2320717 RepID=A0ABR2MZU8_9ASPA
MQEKFHEHIVADIELSMMLVFLEVVVIRCWAWFIPKFFLGTSQCLPLHLAIEIFVLKFEKKMNITFASMILQELHDSHRKVLTPIKPSNYQLPDDRTSFFVLGSLYNSKVFELNPVFCDFSDCFPLKFLFTLCEGITCGGIDSILKCCQQGEVEFRSILFMPPVKNEDLLNKKIKNIRLYVKRVFILDDFDGELVSEFVYTNSFIIFKWSC